MQRPTNSILLFICCLFIMMPGLSGAADGNLEKDMQNALDQSRNAVFHLQDRIARGVPASDLFARMKSLAEDIRVSHLLLAERFRRQEARVSALGAVALERHHHMADTYRRAVEEYLDIVDGMKTVDDLSSPSLERLKTLLDRILPKKKRPIFGALPYRNLDYPATIPPIEPSVFPAYRGGDKTVSDDDLKGTPLAPVSAPIAELAESLDWNPVAIYEWVKNNIDTRWYWGCMKGAEETLRQKSGNDADQAALLVALLRSAGYPSRFVRGVVEFFPGIDTARNLTGIEDEREIAAFFRKAGIPSAPVIKGGGIANIMIEHIWVETQVPYANYRGAVIDEHGKTWLGLDTSIKAAGYTYNQPEAIPGEFPLSDIRDSYLEAVRDETPLEYIKSEIDGWLSQNQPEMTHESFLRTKTLAVEEMKILPASLQFIQVAVTGEYTELPDELVHTVRFRAASTGDDDFFDITLPAFRLSNRPVAITCEPETVEDHEIINSYGGLDNTPAYLVSLRPVIMVDGERLVVGKGGLPMGSEYTLIMELTSPNGVERITNTHIMGNVSMVGIVCQSAVMPDEVPDKEKTAETCLHEMAIGYIDRWNKAEDELASLFHLAIARPIPAVVTVGGLIDVTYLLDSPYEFTWKGVFVDADLKTIESAAGLADTNDRQKIFMQLSGLHGSILENLILEDTLQVDGISTAKLFGVVNSSGVPVITIDKGTVDALLPSLPFENAVKEDIANAVNRNFIVRVPQSEIAYEDWTGIGYLKEDPETGEAGWMLSGMIAGASTAWDISRWVELIRDRLRHPFSEPPNYDPASACSVVKIDATDRQKNTAGRKLDKRLEVMVRDREGRPVKDALVTFTVIAGGGTCRDNETAITTATDYRGLASTDMTLGRFTAENPVMWQAAGQTYAQQVGVNLVDVSLANGVKIASPFTAYGFPGEAFRMRKLYQAGSIRQVLDFAGFVSVAVEDENGNPISNCDVTFTAQDAVASTPTPCIADGEDRTFAMLVKSGDECLKGIPTYDSCRCQGSPCESGTRSITETTNRAGASVHVFMGAVPGADYTVTAAYETLEATFDFATLPFGNCDGSEPPSYQLKLVHVTPADAYGRSIDAAKPGAVIPITARLYYLKEGAAEEEVTFDCSGTPKTCTRIIGTRDYSEYTGFDAASVTFGSQAGILKGDGIFSADYIVQPGKNEITIKGNGTITVRKSVTNCQECRISEQEQTGETQVATVLYGVTIATPPRYALPIDDNDLLIKDFNIEYTVNPQEYSAGASYLVIFEKDSGDATPLAYVPVDSTGAVTATLARGMKFDSNSDYEAKVVLNCGSGEPLEIWSEPIILELVRVDLDADLDRNGAFDEDDPLEHTFGLALLQNIDDDGLNGVLDYQETGENPDEDDLVPIRITAAARTGKLILTPSKGGKKIKVWNSPNKGEGALVIDMTDESTANDAVEWDMTGAEDPVRVEETYYVEGIDPSAALGDIELKLRLEDGEGNEVVSDCVSVTVYTVSLTTDFNRDRKIDTSDEEILAKGDPFYFWINDDADRNGDVIKSSEDDIPDLPSISSFPNHGDDKVNGMRDLIDFFPVRIMIQPAAVLDSPNTRLRLRTEEGAVNIACTAIPDGDHAGDYLTDINTARALQEAATHGVTDEGYTIDDEVFLEQLKEKAQGILIAEGRLPMKNQSLVLEIEQDMITIVESTLKLSIDSVETMFRYRNLRPSLEASGGGPDRDDVTNFPDDPENDSDFVFIHGFNVTAENARGWHSEIFKRLFWSGSKARFHGVTWYGDQGLVFKKLRYYVDVTNAFNTGEHFADYIDEELKGDVTVMAHSAGNIVVSAAIHDHGASVNRYFMFNAPLSKEVFLGESQAENPGLIHAEWRQENNKYDAALYASEWYKLFGDSDSRSKLTWRYRFNKVTEKDVINFYSITDDVLHDYDREGTSSPSIFTALTHPWCAAQLLKGREWNVSMGWGFNDRIYPEGWSYYPVPDSSVSIMYTARQMDDVIAQGTDVLKTAPFFSPDGMEELFEEGEAGSDFAKESHARIMAYGIPARDYAVGANYTFQEETKNVNMANDFVLEDTNKNLIWPSNMIELDKEGNAFPLWEHSSIRDVAYVYNYSLYDKLSGK